MQLLAAVATFRVQQLRQLGDVGGDAPGLVAGEQLGRRPPAGLVLNINVASATTCAQPLVFGGSVGLRCSYTPILPTKRPKRPRIADDGKYIEKFFRHPFSFVRGD
jgi:hypothetical protein